MPDELRAVASLLTGQCLCRDCIGTKADLPRWRVDDAIQQLGAMVKTSAELMACAGCRKQVVVYTLG